MAPELALKSFRKLKTGSIVLDPMSGSGTVARHAAEFGHHPIAYDLDPLAVLISKVWNTSIDVEKLDALFTQVIGISLSIDPQDIELPWIDHDEETAKFVRFWFGKPQVVELRCLAYVMWNAKELIGEDVDQSLLDVLRVCLSRIIVTKEQCASLARDTSHSRPHKVVDTSEYQVLLGFERSFAIVRKRLVNSAPPGKASIEFGDARNIKLADNSVDYVLTSPPYLNAIDYLRGHRMSLVWLGYSISELRNIRSSSIGAERGPDEFAPVSDAVYQSIGEVEKLPRRYQRMIERYVIDIGLMIEEIARVLKPGHRAKFIVGNSCLKNVFVKNADAVVAAGTLVGLRTVNRIERDLPVGNRYLPTPDQGTLGKRMRTESIITMKAI
jgi:SAM-dependent methyltransferase